jgi:GWxTD domain-containing protein
MIRRLNLRNFRWAVFCAFLGMSAALAVPELAAETVGRGDFELFLDSAAFRGDDGRSIQEVYVRIRNSGLRFKASDGLEEARIRLSVQIADSSGVVVSESEEIRFQETNPEDAESPLRFHTVINRYALEPGAYSLHCVVEDLYSPKVSIVGFMKKQLKAARVEGYPLIVPSFPTDAVSVSNAKFLWEIASGASQTSFHPNPPRLYGLHQDSLRVYVEAYVPDTLAVSNELLFEMEILDHDGTVIKRHSLPLGARKTAGEGKGGSLVTYPIVIQEDVNTLKAGNYTLYLNAGLPERLMVRMRAGGFNVAWDLRTWEISRRTYLEEARFLLEARDYDKFVELSLGEQEKLLQDVWKKLDPDPLTGVNEAYEKFIARLEYVNANYSDYQTGLFSDRGLVYLKYGPPDEVEVDVVPMNRESLSDAMQKVEDRFHPINYSNTGARLRFARPGENIFVDPRHLGMVGEQGNVGFPYELWSYNSGGDAVLERDRSLEPDLGMRFIFVDTEGYGRYKLETSSTMLSK